MIALRLAGLDASAAELERWHETLDGPERARAAAFRFAIDRDRFVARRGRLRAWLGELAGIAPAALRFGAGAHGKPRLLDRPALRFSSSHSDDRWLAAAAWGHEVGCDLERHRPDLADPAVAERLFAADERAAFAALPPDRYTEGFFACWSRKEAFVKAIGQGLSYPLDAFAVTVDGPARFIRGGVGWSLHALDTGPGWSAALVAPAGVALAPAERLR